MDEEKRERRKAISGVGSKCENRLLKRAKGEGWRLAHRQQEAVRAQVLRVKKAIMMAAE